MNDFKDSLVVVNLIYAELVLLSICKLSITSINFILLTEPNTSPQPVTTIEPEMLIHENEFNTDSPNITTNTHIATEVVNDNITDSYIADEDQYYEDGEVAEQRDSERKESANKVKSFSYQQSLLHENIKTTFLNLSMPAKITHNILNVINWQKYDHINDHNW